MKTALLIHLNGIPEVLQAEAWTIDTVREALHATPGQLLEHPLVAPRRCQLWQVADLNAAVNPHVEILIGEGNYYHLRGPALLVKEAGKSLSHDDLAYLTVKLVTGRG